MDRTHLEIAAAQIRFARQYMLGMLEGLNQDEWFMMPKDCPSHIAWQVGHLAMAEYALTMIRIRGKEPEDQEIITSDFFRTFKKGTSPVADAKQYPTVDEIRATLDRVHAASQAELANCSDAQLQEKLPEPYAVFDNKLGSVLFCSAHELIHAGQIGLIRRLLGRDPIR